MKYKLIRPLEHRLIAIPQLTNQQFRDLQAGKAVMLSNKTAVQWLFDNKYIELVHEQKMKFDITKENE